MIPGEIDGTSLGLLVSAYDQRVSLELPSDRGLSRKKKRFWVLAFATQFERAEIFVPGLFRHFGPRFNPEAKLV